jgi:hypothetical protein
VFSLTSFRHRAVFRKHQQSAVDLIQATTRLRNRASDVGARELVQLCNVLQVELLLNFDVSVVAQDLLGARTGVRRRVYSRVLGLLAVTWFETVGRLLGKPSREVTAAVDADQQTRAEIVRLSKSLHGLRRKYDPALRRIRNATIAHRETDAAAQLSISSPYESG